ncbi:MAG: diguanylate cyclase [Rhodospirillum sp.]|nr:diguanylate cyclase [Rhodospirillum sp.]MCF8490747.1 diguanylate cyclase [Rhodospirillum sp.]MCF8502307.1 diguanylate cyclase [Rhodospirillum sp.]
MTATVCVDPDWAPYEIINDQGEHEGIAADLLRLAAERSNVTLTLHPTKDWGESLTASRAGQCDLLSFLNQTSQREAWLIFTDPVFVDPNVLVTREEHPFIPDLAAVAGETIALPKGSAIEEWVRVQFPNLTVVTTESEAEAFAMVSRQTADMTMRSLIVAVYTIKKKGWFNLKIAGQVPGYENHLRIGVRKDKKGLRDRLNMGVRAVSETERQTIANKHVSIVAQMGVDYALIGRIVGLFAVIFLTNLFWIGKLRQANQKLRILARTDSLTGLANRAALNDRFLVEVERATRYGRPFSIIMIDVDHFKAINDDLGHLMGDRTLITMAGLAKANSRGPDIVSRWGGEEFLILCPETDQPQAEGVAERIRQTVREHPFEAGRRVTVSVGVAVLRPGDDPDSLLHRADVALYRAKNEGRDRVRVY